MEARWWLFLVAVVACVLVATLSALSLMRWCGTVDAAVDANADSQTSAACRVPSDQSKICFLECDENALCTVQKEEHGATQSLECLEKTSMSD
jgi:hypothetical protein